MDSRLEGNVGFYKRTEEQLNSNADPIIAKKVIQGLYNYLDKNSIEGGSARQKIDLLGMQLKSGSDGVYVMALELFREYYKCIFLQSHAQAPLYFEKHILVRVEREEVPSPVRKKRIKSDAMSYGVAFYQLEVQQAAFEAIQTLAEKYNMLDESRDEALDIQLDEKTSLSQVEDPSHRNDSEKSCESCILF